jgi:hypothetical protein
MIENRYCKHLNLPFDFTPVEPDFAGKQHVRYDMSLHPEFITWLASLGIEPGFAEVFKKTPTDIEYPWALHVDGLELNDHVKINFVYGGGRGKMLWAKLKPEFTHRNKVTVVNTAYLWAPMEECDILYSDSLLKPSIVNAGQLHTVVDVSEDRIAYSFMLRYINSKKRLLWDDAITLFKEYIDDDHSRR